MTGMPELGSKISLISKADIRYEGRLFTVDPQECTIALANVRSFGTEDREALHPIIAQTTVYDYILFRGSDIKDIRVVNNVPLPNDPAIMQMHLPNQQNFPQQNLPQFAGGPPQMNQFAQFGPMQGGSMGPSMPQQSQHQQAQSPIQSQHQDSRSGTPQNLSRKSPSSDMGNQASQNQRENQSGGGKDKAHQNQRNNQRNNNQQQGERRDSGRNEVQENKGYRNPNQNQRQHNQMNNNNHQLPQGQQQRGYNNRNNQQQQHQQQIRGNQGGSARMRGPPMNQNYNRQQNNQGAPIPNQNKPNGQQQQRTVSKPLKFENEFDFESTNRKFEELRAQLAVLKVGSEETKNTDQVNGEIEKKDDSGNETGADHEAEGDDNGYDKNKSFFDNISCEAVERSKGKTQRTDWRQERKINSETFGYAFNRRGNFRGRGGYYNNQYNRGPRPGGYRGPNPNYRPMRNNHRNPNVEGRSNVSSTNNQANGQQSQNQATPVAAN